MCRNMLVINLFKKKFFFFGLGPFPFYVYCISIGSVVSGTLATAFDCVVIACSLDSIRPGLVQGYKAPKVVG